MLSLLLLRLLRLMLISLLLSLDMSVLRLLLLVLLLLLLHSILILLRLLLHMLSLVNHVLLLLEISLILMGDGLLCCCCILLKSRRCRISRRLGISLSCGLFRRKHSCFCLLRIILLLLNYRFVAIRTPWVWHAVVARGPLNHRLAIAIIHASLLHGGSRRRSTSDLHHYRHFISIIGKRRLGYIDNLRVRLFGHLANGSIAADRW